MIIINIIYYLNIKNIDKYEGENKTPRPRCQKSQILVSQTKVFIDLYRWIVVQPANKNPRGRYLERIGYWLPRKTSTVQRSMILNKHKVQYWLGMGATCTNRVHRILEKFNFVPKTPVPFGSASLYEKPEKEYSMQYYSK